MAVAIVWFRNDLRLSDNPALRAALETGLPVLPVYIHDPDGEGEARVGAASDAWRARSLAALDADLRARGSRLRLFVGHSLQVLATLAAAADAAAVFWNRRYEPSIEARDARIKRELRGQGLQVESFNGSLLFEPWTLKTGKGGPYRVFTPFWRAARARWVLESRWSAPAHIGAVDEAPDGVGPDLLRLAPRDRWDGGFWEHWSPGEAGAEAALEAFVDGALRGYAQDRDRPDRIACRRTCTSARSRRGAVPKPCKPSGAASRTATSRPGCASWCGANSPRTCSITSRTPSSAISTSASTRSSGRGPVAARSSGGAMDAPGCRSWMPGCASSGRRAGCTTACA